MKDIFPKVFIDFVCSVPNEIRSFLFPLLIQFLMSILIAAMLYQWTSKVGSQNCPIFWLQNQSCLKPPSQNLSQVSTIFSPSKIVKLSTKQIRSKFSHKAFYHFPVGQQGLGDVRLSNPILFAAIPMHLKAATGRHLFVFRAMICYQY